MVLQHIAVSIVHGIKSYILVGHPVIQFAMISVAFWLIWRLWAFTIQPFCHRDCPKELPYWTPGLANYILSKIYCS